MKDELLIKFLLKETSEDENIIVQNWLSANAKNATYFGQLEKIWQTSEKLADKNQVDVEKAWLQFKVKADALQINEPIVRPLKKNYTWLSMAAVLIIAIGAWSIYALFGPASYTELISNNEVISKILPDGSELTINKNTQISYATNFKNNRSVRLQKGDAFFEVAHNKNKPFVIQIDKVSVKVVGTSFNIKHLKDETEIVVETGIVSVKLGNQEVKLTKGERILVNADTKQLVKKKSTDQLYNYYRTQLFIANGTSLHELVAVLNEAYGEKIVVDDKVKNLSVYITLQLGSLNKNLKIICDALYLKISRNQDEILLSY